MPPKSLDVIVERLDGFRFLFEEKIENINKELKEIKIQTTTTNGRTTKLEGKVNKIIGGLIVVEVVIIALLKYL